MFSYVSIICAFDIRRNQSFDRSVTRLGFMAAMWREDEDSHATLLVLLCYLCGQMQIAFV